MLGSFNQPFHDGTEDGIFIKNDNIVHKKSSYKSNFYAPKNERNETN